MPSGTDQHRPTINVDCNTVINVVGRKRDDPVAVVACFLKEWTDHGFIIILVVDGDILAAE